MPLDRPQEIGVNIQHQKKGTTFVLSWLCIRDHMHSIYMYMFCFALVLFPTHRPPTRTPARSHHRVKSCTINRWPSSFPNPSQPVFPIPMQLHSHQIKYPCSLSFQSDQRSSTSPDTPPHFSFVQYSTPRDGDLIWRG